MKTKLPIVIEAYRQERKAFLDHSKKSMSHIIARYLCCVQTEKKAN